MSLCIIMHAEKCMGHNGFRVTAFTPNAQQEIHDNEQRGRLSRLTDEMLTALTRYDPRKYSTLYLDRMTGMAMQTDTLGLLTLTLIAPDIEEEIPLGKIQKETTPQSEELLSKIKALWECLTNNEMLVLNTPKSTSCTIL